MKILTFIWIIIILLNIGTIYFIAEARRLNKNTIETLMKTAENMNKIKNPQ